MRRLLEEFSISKNPLQTKSDTVLEIYFYQKRCSSVQSDYISLFALRKEMNGDNQKKLRLVTAKFSYR